VCTCVYKYSIERCVYMYRIERQRSSRVSEQEKLNTREKETAKERQRAEGRCQ